MLEVLVKHIQEKVQLTAQEIVQLETYFVSKKLKKRQYLLQEGEVCKNIAFISKGLLKTYYNDEKGNEHITLLGWEGWWLSDFYSFITGEVGELSIEAVEEAEVLLLSKDNYDSLIETMPMMEKYFRLLYERSLATKEKRLLSNLTDNAEEKYAQILTSYPELVSRVPQHLLASYLGLTPETVSRIKKKMK